MNRFIAAILVLYNVPSFECQPRLAVVSYASSNSTSFSSSAASSSSPSSSLEAETRINYYTNGGSGSMSPFNEKKCSGDLQFNQISKRCTWPDKTDDDPICQKNPQKPYQFTETTRGYEITGMSDQIEEDAEFVDGEECDRNCDGTRKICRFKFNVENFNSMGNKCGNCSNKVMADCFNDQCIVGNGFQRNVLVANRKLPGPAIRVCENDRVVIDVRNYLVGASLAIHWHGILQMETPWMDGVPMVTQCPISPMNTFRYIFNAREAGTFVWHAHQGLYRTDGIFGEIIIREKRDPNLKLYDFDLSSHAMLMTDWMTTLANDFAPGVPNRSLSPQSVLVNGLGCYNDKSKNESNCDTIPIPVFYMQYRKSFRLRIANVASQNCPIEVSIEGHALTVIATDAVSVLPKVVDTIITHAGERYDAVINIPPKCDACEGNKKVAYARFRLIGNCIANEIQTFAKIIYVDSQLNFTKQLMDHLPNPNPLNYSTPFKSDPIVLNGPKINRTNEKTIALAELETAQNCLKDDEKCMEFVNLRNLVPDRTIHLNFSVVMVDNPPVHFQVGGNSTFVAHINNIVGGTPTVPLLTQDYTSEQFCNAETIKPSQLTKDGFGYCTHVISIKLGDVVDIVLRDLGRPGLTSHPFHMHGNTFAVIDMGTQEQYESGETPFRNATHNPVLKDTVPVPSGGFVTLRFIATNPGFWLFHCHLEWHMYMGMHLILKVGEKSNMVPPLKDFPTCGNFIPPVCSV